MYNQVLNEGLIVNSAKALTKSEILTQIRRLGRTTPEELERAVFRSLVGHDREEVDWSVEDNHAGYYTWVRSFDGLISELIEDNSILMEEDGRLVPTEAEPQIEFSHLVYPAR